VRWNVKRFDGIDEIHSKAVTQYNLVMSPYHPVQCVRTCGSCLKDTQLIGKLDLYIHETITVF